MFFLAILSSVMRIRAYLSLIGLGTCLAWVAWAIILLNIDPTEASVPEFGVFYLTLFCGLVGTLTFFMTIFRVFVLRRKVVGREIRVAFRHSILFSVVTIFSLFLSAVEKFSFWYTLILIIGVAGIEYLFLQMHRGRG